MESVATNYSDDEKNKVLASFKNRLKTTFFNSESIQAELESIAKECGTTVTNLFVLAETEQLPNSLNDKAMSLFSIAKTFRN